MKKEIKELKESIEGIASELDLTPEEQKVFVTRVMQKFREIFKIKM